MFDRDLFGDAVIPRAASLLARRFIVPPFSVLNAREGEWQERKRQWLALGIKSELGRGEDLSAMGGAIERRDAIKRGGVMPSPAGPDATRFGVMVARPSGGGDAKG